MKLRFSAVQLQLRAEQIRENYLLHISNPRILHVYLSEVSLTQRDCCTKKDITFYFDNHLDLIAISVKVYDQGANVMQLGILINPKIYCLSSYGEITEVIS